MRSEKHYRLIATLSRKHGLAWSNTEGTQTYSRIFSNRIEEGERFAILYDPHLREYLCVDMHATRWDPNTLEIYMPTPQVFPTEDAAVMAARLQL